MASNSSALILPSPPPGGAATNSVDIHGIKGPVYIPSSYAWIGWVLLALLAAAAGWVLWKKRRRKSTAKPGVVIPPHRRAKDRLRNVNELLSDPYAYCSLVSDVVREYLDEMRSTSILHPDHKALLEEFLSRCDLVKFARFEPSQDELKSLLEAALRFIEETAPIEMPAGGTQPAGTTAAQYIRLVRRKRPTLRRATRNPG